MLTKADTGQPVSHSHSVDGQGPPLLGSVPIMSFMSELLVGMYMLPVWVIRTSCWMQVCHVAGYLAHGRTNNEAEYTALAEGVRVSLCGALDAYLHQTTSVLHGTVTCPRCVAGRSQMWAPVYVAKQAALEAAAS